MDQQTLNQIEDQVTEARDKRSRAEGALDTWKKTCMEKFGVDTIEGLQEKVAEIETKRDAIKARIDEGMKALKEIMPGVA